MKDELVTFETAKLAKEKGFPQNNTPLMYDEGVLTRVSFPLGSYPEDFKDRYYYAPTQSSLQKWLMEEHNMFLESRQTSLGDTEWKVVDPYGAILVKPRIWPYYDGYPVKGHMFEESGREITLQEALKLIK